MNRLKFRELGTISGLTHWMYIYPDGEKHIVLDIKDRNDKITDWMARDDGEKFWYKSLCGMKYTPVQLLGSIVGEIYEARRENLHTSFRAEINVLPGSGKRYACEVMAMLDSDRLTVIAHNHVDDWDEAVTWCDVLITVENPYELACALEMGGHK